MCPPASMESDIFGVMTDGWKPAVLMGEQGVNGQPRLRTAPLTNSFQLARFPTAWNHAVEKNSRQINMLEQVRFADLRFLSAKSATWPEFALPPKEMPAGL